MALLKFLFDRGESGGTSVKARGYVYESPDRLGLQCANTNCITVTEPVSARRKFDVLSGGAGGALILGCAYCDHRSKVQWVGNITARRYCPYDHAVADIVLDWLKSDELAIFNSIKQAEELGYEPYISGPQRTIMEETEIDTALREIGRQIIQDCEDPRRLLLLGVRSNGIHLARRIAVLLEPELKRMLEIGEIEIYGIGEGIRRSAPAESDTGPLVLKDREIILVDDVIYTGRTARSALSIIFRSGRPRSVRLAALIDRGHREVPVKPNYVGKHIPSSPRERVRVRLRETERDPKDEVVIYSIIHPSDADGGFAAQSEPKTAR